MSLRGLLEWLGGTKIERTREGYRLLCLHPDHNDTKPSLYVNETKGVFYCFGCGWHGSLKRLVAEVKGVSFSEAEKILEEFDIHLSNYSSRTYSSSVNSSDELRNIHIALNDLRDAPLEIVNFLVRRKYKIPFLRKYSIAWVYYLGEPAVVFPLFYYEKLYGYQLRMIREKKYITLYFDKSEKIFYFPQQKIVSPKAVVVEGPFDALRVMEAVGDDFTVIALLGSVSSYKLSLLSAFRSRVFRSMYLLADHDDGGRSIAATIQAEIPDISVFYLDPDPDGAGVNAIKKVLGVR